MNFKIYFQIVLMMLFALNLTSQSEVVNFECDCPHTTDSYNRNISLNHVTFHGVGQDELIPIEEDGGGLYPEIQYFSNRNRYPVAYVSGSRAIVSAAFTSSCNHPLWIRGTFDDGNDKFCFEAKYVVPQGYGDYYYPMTASDYSFGDASGNDHVDAFPNFQIYWEASPDGNNYSHIGTSNNPLYVTYHSPTPGTIIHHSTIANSCTAAEGNTDHQEIVDAIYALYQSRCIQTVTDDGIFTGSCLSYWGDIDIAASCASTSDLYLGGSGRSENFAELFKDMIDVQGLNNPVFNEPNIIEVSYDIGPLMADLESDLVSDFSTVALATDANVTGAGILNAVPDLSLFKEVPATPTNPAMYPVAFGFSSVFIADPLISLSLESEPMLYVKNFTQCSDNTFFLTDADTDIAYTSKPNGINHSKLIDNGGLGAQGNNDPPSRFSSLFLVNYFEKVYDPSYGVSSSRSVAEWESKVIDGYGIRLFDILLRDDNNSPPGVIQKDLDYIHKCENAGILQTVEN